MRTQAIRKALRVLMFDLKRSEDLPVTGARGSQCPRHTRPQAEHAQAATLSRSGSLLQGFMDPLLLLEPLRVAVFAAMRPSLCWLVRSTERIRQQHPLLGTLLTERSTAPPGE